MTSSYANVAAFLRYLGLENFDTFNSRFTIQKVVYLLEDFGATLGFGYSWYIHGPYSPQLTHTLFKATDKERASRRELSSGELRIINDVRNFLGQDFYSIEALELLVSLIYLVELGPSAGLDSKSKIFGFLRERKPHFSLDQVEAAWAKIEKAGRWNDYTAKLRNN